MSVFFIGGGVISLTNLIFLFFILPGLFVVYYNPFLCQRNFKNCILIFASFVFYALGEPYYVFLLFGSALLNYTCAALTYKYKRLGFMRYIIIVIDVAVLIMFKYINTLLLIPGLWDGGDSTAFPFPLGLSYYTFMAISFVVDSKNEKQFPKLQEALLYMTLFASITAGPITQYASISSQLKDRNEAFGKIKDGLELLVCGFIKKVLFADVLGYLVGVCFENQSALSVCTAWLGGIAYTLQLYFDFSGYSDMAVGIGKLFGFNLCTNFNYPYAASTVSEFWKRWHISLTQWFTKYIYIPLGGNRVSMPRHIFNLFIVWLVTGLWHGNGLTFIVWAMIYFIIQLAEKHTLLRKIPNFISRIYTLITIILAWCVFRADTLTDAFMYIRTMFGIGTNSFCDQQFWTYINGYGLPLILGIIFSFPVYPALKGKLICGRKIFRELSYFVIIVAFTVSVILSLGANFSAPLYADF